MRIAIADDHQIFRDGMRRLLETEPGFEVVAEAVDGLDASRIVRDVHPDVMLLDVAMPRMGGVEALTMMQEDATRVILLTAGIEPSELLRAIQLGARGVVLKERPRSTSVGARRSHAARAKPQVRRHARRSGGVGPRPGEVALRSRVECHRRKTVRRGLIRIGLVREMTVGDMRQNSS